MRTNRLTLMAGLLGLTATSFGQNLLLNPSFDLPTTTNDCAYNKGAPSDWVTDLGALNRNSDIFVPPCPRDGDGIHASWAASGGFSAKRAYQVVTLAQPADGTQTYKFSGFMVLGSTDSSLGIVASFAIIAGSNPNATPLQTVSVTQKNGQMSNWTPFTVTAVPPNGTTQLLARFQYVANNAGFNAMHIDACNLSLETQCPNQPTVTGISPTRAPRGSTNLPVVLTGTNFAGSPTVQLTGPQTINAASVVVDSPTQVTATFNIPADAVHEQYDVVYSQTDCEVVTDPGAFLVYLPTFTNGSFELPAVAACDTPSNTFPTDWRAGESAEWGFEGRLKLNGFLPGDILTIKPSCPPPDGSQYGTIASTTSTGGANAVAYQTVSATNGGQYTWSGFFAGTGNNTVTLRMRDGGPGGTILATKDIRTGAGSYDWNFAFLSGQAASDAVTLECAVARTGTGPNATHADALAFEQCSGAIPTISSITPSFGTNTGNLEITNLAGTGFSGTPTVLLVKPGTAITATNVQVVTPSQITCMFDLTGASSGRYDVIVKQGGCIASQPGVSVLVAAAAFVNGSFEEPTATLDCGPPPVIVGGIPTGWNSDAGLLRDGNAPLPPVCPSPADGGHYGFMSSGSGGTLRAWQTVVVLPGGRYTFSGQFAGLGDCIIRLLDGDENGLPLASTTVFTSTDGGAWLPGSVSATATSNVMTVVWEIANAAPGGMADGLTFASDCNPIWADADGDTDVDLDDFGVFQRCVSGSGGPIPSSPEYCVCFNRNGDNAIDIVDFVQFQNCSSGSGVPAVSCP